MPSIAHDRNPSLVQRINALMADHEDMKARAGGWVIDIPQADRDAWQDRKNELLADIAAAQAAR